MTSTRKPRPASRWLGLISATLAVAWSGHAAAQAQGLFYERAVMAAADERCGLFTPELSGALAAATAQARGAALRAGASAEALRAVERRARARAGESDCASPDLAAAAARVRGAFDGYARQRRASYPGELAGWRAERGASRDIRWRLAQDAGFGPDRMTFGLAGRDGSGALVTVAQFADGAEPYAARLVLRDQGRSTGPYLDRRAGEAAGPPLSRRLAPRGALKAYAAEARSPAGQDLLPKPARAGWAFRFPAQAVQDLIGLDPREAVAVEFLFAGDVTRRAYVEVGDFAAGEAFLKLAAR